MSAAKTYLPHYTVEDYRQWNGDWELWHGIAVSRCPHPDGTARGMSPSPFGRHQRAAARLLYQIQRAFEQDDCSAEAAQKLDWILGTDTIVRPDVVALCDGIPERHIETTPELIAEVFSDSTRERDRTYKRDLYDEQGVGVYLLLDPEAETLEAYRRDKAGKWQHEQVSERIEFSICDDCEICLDRSSLFAK